MEKEGHSKGQILRLLRDGPQKGDLCLARYRLAPAAPAQGAGDAEPEPQPMDLSDDLPGPADPLQVLADTAALGAGS